MNDVSLLIVVIVVVLGAVFFVLSTRSRNNAQADALAEKMAELSGRLQQTQSGVNERLDALAGRLGDGLREQTEKTGDHLKELHERLAIIDTAQKNLTDLSEQVVGLQDILSNKQARGTFGEIQLNDLVSSVLPPSAYKFQAKMSNGKIADCMLDLPNPPGPIAIDSKFPLESYQALRNATDNVEKVRASRSFSTDVIKHVRDIAERYIIPGETAESAFMFLPSEAIYAELHASFRNVIEESFRYRVWIVSPTTLWATLNTVRAVLKDVHMREQAGVIQTEVVKMLEDVARLDKRVESLRNHFRQADRDIDDINKSSKKLVGRGTRIEEMQLGKDKAGSGEELEPPQVRLKEAE